MAESHDRARSSNPVAVQADRMPWVPRPEAVVVWTPTPGRDVPRPAVRRRVEVRVRYTIHLHRLRPCGNPDPSLAGEIDPLAGGIRVDQLVGRRWLRAGGERRRRGCAVGRRRRRGRRGRGRSPGVRLRQRSRLHGGSRGRRRRRHGLVVVGGSAAACAQEKGEQKSSVAFSGDHARWISTSRAIRTPPPLRPREPLTQSPLDARSEARHARRGRGGNPPCGLLHGSEERAGSAQSATAS